jgi:hypothetical protein
VFEDKGDVISIKYNERIMSYISLVGDKYKGYTRLKLKVIIITLPIYI